MKSRRKRSSYLKNKFNHSFRNKPHILFHNGKWRIYMNEWKSMYRDTAAQLTADDIPKLINHVRTSQLGWRFQ